MARNSRNLKQEEVLSGERLPAGVSIKPLYEQCPHCGADLTKFPQKIDASCISKKQQIDTAANKAQSYQIKETSKRAETPWIFHRNASWMRCCSWMQGFISWMVVPFAYAPKNTTCGDKKSFFCWITRKQTCAVKNDDKSTNNDHHFVPRIQCKLGKRIMHFLRRFVMRKREF
ncbi:hypothetical protein SODG_000857 [Sodalis praecaptivus]